MQQDQDGRGDRHNRHLPSPAEVDPTRMKNHHHNHNRMHFHSCSIKRDSATMTMTTRNETKYYPSSGNTPTKQPPSQRTRIRIIPIPTGMASRSRRQFLDISYWGLSSLVSGWMVGMPSMPCILPCLPLPPCEYCLLLYCTVLYLLFVLELFVNVIVIVTVTVTWAITMQILYGMI